MKHFKSQIAKLVCNLHIFTIVTFTYEFEHIYESYKTDIHNVMEVVWKDSRVDNPVHLTSGLDDIKEKYIYNYNQSLRHMSLHLDSNNGSNSSSNMEQMLIYSIKRGIFSG